MNDLLPTRPEPLTAQTGPAFVLGVDRALRSIKERLLGREGLVTHRFEPGSPQERAFDEGVFYAAQKAMREEMKRQERTRETWVPR